MFKGFASLYNVEIWNSLYAELQLRDTESAIKNKLKMLLIELRGSRSMITLVLMLKRTESNDKTKYDTFYSNTKAEIIINENDIDNFYKSIYATVTSNIQKSLGKDLSWIIDSVIDHNITISKYNPLDESSYVVCFWLWK